MGHSKEKRFPETKISAVLYEWDAGAKTANLVRGNGDIDQILYRRKEKYGGMHISKSKRLKALEEENRQLKRLVADYALNLRVAEDLLGKSSDVRAMADGRRVRDGFRRPLGAPILSRYGLCAVVAAV